MTFVEEKTRNNPSRTRPRTQLSMGKKSPFFKEKDKDLVLNYKDNISVLKDKDKSSQEQRQELSPQ